MYERFTDHAQSAMTAANNAARELGHEYIGTEHILLGLISSSHVTIALKALEIADIRPERIRGDIRMLVQQGGGAIAAGRLPLTPRAKKVIEYAMESSRELNHHYVGSEHLLLGLLREQEGIAATVLNALGFTAVNGRDYVLRALHGESRIPLQLADGVYLLRSASGDGVAGDPRAMILADFERLAGELETISSIVVMGRRKKQ